MIKIEFKVTDEKLSQKEIERLKRGIERWDKQTKEESKVDDATLKAVFDV